MAKIEERKKNEEFYRSIAYTINDIVDSVCSSTSSKNNEGEDRLNEFCF